MSYKILAPAWESSLPTPQKFLLVSLADQANDEGVCWPSIASLTRRTGLQERTVYKHLAELESLGHITRQQRDGRSTIYHVHPCTTCTPVINDTPAPHALPPLHHVHPTPAPRAPITVIEPKEESKPSPNPLKGSKAPIAFKTWLAELKLKAEKPIPPDDPVFDYCEKVGIPEEFLTLHWRLFKVKYSEIDKRQRDWRRVLRNSVRGNWFKVWYVAPNGEATLTTVGMQAKREFSEAA